MGSLDFVALYNACFSMVSDVDNHIGAWPPFPTALIK
jgi:hypothetical protein